MSKLEELIQKYCPNGVEKVELGKVCDIKTGKGITQQDASEGGKYPIISGGISPMGWYYLSNRSANTVTISRVGANAGFVGYIEVDFYLNDKCFSVIPNNEHEELINTRYLFYILKKQESILHDLQSEGGVPTINTTKVGSISIPLPPLPVQEEIVRILDAMTDLQENLEKELEERRKQYAFYRDKLLSFNELTTPPSWRVEWKQLGEVLNYEQPTKYIVNSTEYSDEYDIPVLTAGQSVVLGYTNEKEGIYRASQENPVIIFDDFTTSFHWITYDFKVKSSAMKMLRPKETVNVLFKYVYLAMCQIQYIPAEHSRHWISKYSQFSIPLPPLSVQQEIVAKLDKMEELVSNIENELTERKKQYTYYREQLLAFEQCA